MLLGFRAGVKLNAAVWTGDVLQWPASKLRLRNPGSIHGN
jgi:hypothetical protein